MADDGNKVIYQIEADDSGVDKQIDAVESKLRKKAQEAENAVKKSSQSASEKVSSAASKSAESLSEAGNAAIKLDKRLDDVDAGGVDEAKAAAAEAERQISDMGDAADNAADDLSHMGDEGKESGGKLDKLASVAGGVGKAVGGAFLAVGSAAVGVGVKAVSSANDMDKALNQFSASTGLAAQKSDFFQGILENIYKNNYGEDFSDISTAMAEVRNQIGNLDEADFQNVTESAFALRDTFGYEVPESVRSANSLITQFGVDGDTAMNLITQGAQNGLDFSGELLDSINEYSPQFKKIGLDANDMFGIFDSGTKAGAFNLDKIGDAVKEFSIRAIDGSQTTSSGFQALGMDADTMAAKFAKGGDDAAAAFNQVIGGLASMDDPLAQNAAGTALFGTMWEDLGPDVVTQLSTVSEGIDSTTDSMGELKKVKYDNLDSMFEGLSRSVEMLLLPLGEELIPVLNDVIQDVLPALEEVLPPVIQQFGDFIKSIAPLAAQILPVLVNQLLPPLLELVSALAPILSETILPILSALIDTFLLPIVKLLSQVLPSAIKFFVSIFQSSFGSIFDNAKGILQGIIDFVTGVFTGDWSKAWDGVKNIFGNICGAIGNLFKLPINFVIDGINGFLGGLNKIRIPDWVPGIGGVGINIPLIHRLQVGEDFVPSDWYPTYLDYGERVLTAEQNVRFNTLGGLQGMDDLERGLSAKLSSASDNTLVVHVHADLDGREIARGTAKFTGQQMDFEQL